MMSEPERPSTTARPGDEGKATEAEYHSSGPAVMAEPQRTGITADRR
jgi:hypothetical protein